MSTIVLVTPRSYGKHSTEPIELLRQAGCEVRLNPHGRILTKEEMREAIQGVHAIVVGVDPLDRDVLQAAEQLRLIVKYGVGTDNIDLQAAAERGIPVLTTPGANTEAVADYTFGLMLAAARRIVPIDSGCRSLDWRKQTTIDVSGRTLGLVGLGQIGKAVVRRAGGFGMQIIAFDAYRDETFAAQHAVRYADTLDELLAQADFVSLHVPLTGDTRHLIGREQLGSMRQSAVLINTARGGLIDEEALLEALQQQKIWGAGLDVFEQEPPARPELLTLDNLVIGSHCAASTVQAIDNMGHLAARHILDYLSEVKHG
ncbi:phosphoglycerate dehydrogenase [Paenibacillus daejeonensis]|uniref:phosphoglycerate dehydrogenase n=1 Tax=Paenibacillus daejeonensis TaxID=135193 RepID=UPI00037669F5|nr:phosphoglycerate dehydrogenase [Paenibacillus daejeonensis]